MHIWKVLEPHQTQANQHKRAATLPQMTTKDHRQRHTFSAFLLLLIFTLASISIKAQPSYIAECGLKPALYGFINIPGVSMTLPREGLKNPGWQDADLAILTLLSDHLAELFLALFMP